jgi:hypothetical protein
VGIVLAAVAGALLIDGGRPASNRALRTLMGALDATSVG